MSPPHLCWMVADLQNTLGVSVLQDYEQLRKVRLISQPMAHDS